MEEVKTNKKPKNVVNNVFIGSIIFVLIAYSLLIIITLCWGLLTSLKSRQDFMFGNVIGFPSMELSKKEMLFGNYLTVIQGLTIQSKTTFYQGATHVFKESKNGFFNLLINTILYAGVGAIVLTIVPCVVSYVCAKYKNKLASFIYFLELFTLAMPIVGSYAAELTLVRNLGLYDSFWGNWIQKFHFNSMYFLVFFAFFQSLPDSFIEAAEIDGASQFRTMTTIVLPLAGKMIFTIALIQFVGLWNEYQTALLYMPTHPTLAVAVYLMANGANANVVADQATKTVLYSTPGRVAACMLLAIPIFIIFLVFREKMMGNISMGGLKE